MTRVSISEAQRTLSDFLHALDHWKRRLEKLSRSLPEPVFEPETDEPLNAAAGIRALVGSILEEEIAAVEKLARIATTLSEDQPGGASPAG